MTENDKGLYCPPPLSGARSEGENYLRNAENGAIAKVFTGWDLRRLIACSNACILPDGTPIPTKALEDGEPKKLIEWATVLVQLVAVQCDCGLTESNGFKGTASALAKLKETE